MSDETTADLLKRAKSACDESDALIAQAKRLRAEAKAMASRAFDRAIRATGRTNERVSQSLGIDNKRIRKLRSDDSDDLDAIPSAADIIMADAELGERFLSELKSERLRVHGKPPAVTLEQQALELLDALSVVSQSITAPLRKTGVLRPMDCVPIESATHSLDSVLEKFKAMLRAAEVVR